MTVLKYASCHVRTGRERVALTIEHGPEIKRPSDSKRPMCEAERCDAMRRGAVKVGSFGASDCDAEIYSGVCDW